MRFLSFTFLLALSSPLFSQDSTTTDPRLVQPERPTVATHAHTVAPGYLELETGLEADRAPAGKRTFSSPTELKLGLASHLQLDLFTPLLFAGPGQTTGLGDLALGLKWRLLDHNAVLGDFAILPVLKFPSGSPANGTGSGTTDVSLTAIASYVIGGVAMDLNAAYTRVGASGSSGASSAALWTASFGVPVVGALSWALELFGNPTVDGSGTVSSVEFLTGPTYLVSRELNLDLGFIAPIRGVRGNAVYAGVVWNLGAVW